jgi:DNA-3-methyladenine glycosylase II
MRDAIQHLARSCEVMRRLIKEHGAFTLSPAKRTPYESLIRAVAHQQLHATAAERILERFVALTPGKAFPTPEEIAKLPLSAMRGVGFSEAKAHAIYDIAEKVQSGLVPSARAITRLSDEEIVERLVQVRGVGRWTVEMLLIFQLGRMDVLPVDDFGVRSGFAAATGAKELPRPKALLEFGERWRPYRTVAAWYLWRTADAQKAAAKSAKAKSSLKQVAAKTI